MYHSAAMLLALENVNPLIGYGLAGLWSKIICSPINGDDPNLIKPSCHDNQNVLKASGKLGYYTNGFYTFHIKTYESVSNLFEQ